MFITDFCNSNDSSAQRRQKIHKRKLELMVFYRDALERRISALTASIKTLEEQINRDNELSADSIN
ncbi:MULTISPECIES: hypothetical protein [Prochlorococcus]|uniref:Uncharacterized protein n=1 Tax=Prochlorococcus marinus (strain SARG / CCMP1375 / SS120) TaxID=167539 RepID=Q7VBY0_PROMA|nr:MULTISPECIES: hypothetical protein [Prochlorococcus]AAQ00007.1 Predicted protein [Prochlorococcus marinus subsp. marinus str. CCMP1375]KGG18939.1 hypothetical protein EV08_1426 [Prochlorococcus marinus str. SS2]KGG23523.1 hypothetical protein EV09_1147 [Prochlorococcus marinus str. SS35]KGG32241.1 hypothetical protein EV10_1356 [Prochlorococcus marinus str. SS51]KGG35067.1 hypothetical protein EV11_1469 [Prochlorococcus sp. SS52]